MGHSRVWTIRRVNKMRKRDEKARPEGAPASSSRSWMMRASHALIGSASPEYVMRGPRPTWLPAGERREHKEPLTDNISIRKACQAPAREPEKGKTSEGNG